MSFWLDGHWVLAPGKSITIDYGFGGQDRGAVMAATVPYYSRNEWVLAVGQGLQHVHGSGFGYFVTVENRGGSSEAFQIRGGNLS